MLFLLLPETPHPKQFVSTLTIELERQLTLKVDEAGLLLRHLYGYNSVCIVKPATPLRIPGRLNLGLIVALKTHAILHKPKKEASIRSAFTQRI